MTDDMLELSQADAIALAERADESLRAAYRHRRAGSTERSRHAARVARVARATRPAGGDNGSGR